MALLASLPAIGGVNHVEQLMFKEANVLRVFAVSFASFIIAEFINTNIIARFKYYSRKKHGIEPKKEKNACDGSFYHCNLYWNSG